jgi:hypothetical protein
MSAQTRTNIPTTRWPDAWWVQIFSVIAAYPKSNPDTEVINDTRASLIGMRSTLPCKKCRGNWRMKIQKNPLTDKIMSSRESLFRWMCDRYREINKRRRSLSNNKIAKYYMDRLYESKPVDVTTDWILIAAILFGIFICIKMRH